MVSVMKKSNYRYAGFALLVAAVMFLYLNSGTMMHSNGMMRQNEGMSFNGWGWLMITGAVFIFMFSTFLLFRKGLLKAKHL